ncbi:RNase P [Methanocella sp. CWC-04]|uniref:Ribonuclease P protein component 2 n=1 Tax=Methanooceanicella nereidis TaxID=2052831 RepID=A0AAP2REE0_9EURY|nr:Rpp14/Pop5 family protein [Methanocella sp. CWC-04]MCD1296149.1 RNase P [Methanocella sp. CWC-04]
MKILPSSLREKKRYIAFEVITEADEPIDRKSLLDEIFFSTQSLMGDVGSSEIGYRLMDFDGARGVIRVNHGAVEKARAAISTVCSIKGYRTLINILGVSGTIRAATEKYIACESIPSTNILSLQITTGKFSGTIVKERGDEVDMVPENKEVLKRSNVRYVSMTSFDLDNSN